MKNYLFVLVIALLLAGCQGKPEKNTRTRDSLAALPAVKAAYGGIPPCTFPGCRNGTSSELVLYADFTFTNRESYLTSAGKDTIFFRKGTWKTLHDMDKPEVVIYQLSGERPDDLRFFTQSGDTALRLSDRNHRDINYTLRKK